MRPPVARCGSCGTSTTARQRASKCPRTRSASMSSLVRSQLSTTTQLAACVAWPWAISQSSVLLARLAPSTVGAPTITRLSASASVPSIAECTSPVPESVITML